VARRAERVGRGVGNGKGTPTPGFSRPVPAVPVPVRVPTLSTHGSWADMSRFFASTHGNPFDPHKIAGFLVGSVAGFPCQNHIILINTRMRQAARNLNLNSLSHLPPPFSLSTRTAHTPSFAPDDAMFHSADCSAPSWHLSPRKSVSLIQRLFISTSQTNPIPSCLLCVAFSFLIYLLAC
jgi:hypothetical protein